MSVASEHRLSPRRAPRVACIVVVPENHVVSPEALARYLTPHADREVKIIVACAGQPADLGALQRTVRNAEFLLAPVGTTSEELRELAMRQAPGDIVNLLDGTISVAPAAEPSAVVV